MNALVTQTSAELRMTLRRGESVLLALGIPVALLVTFSLVKILPIPHGTRSAVDFLAPGILSLAIMSTGMVSLGIATAFERQNLILKRLGATPLGRPRLLLAKTLSVVAIELLQAAVIVIVGVALGWRPSIEIPAALGAVVLATAAFAGIGLLLAGTLRAETVLAGANGLWLALLLLGGMLFPLDSMPSALRVVAEALPASALSRVLDAALGAGTLGPAQAWIVLAAWAVAAPMIAAWKFRWE